MQGARNRLQDLVSGAGLWSAVWSVNRHIGGARAMNQDQRKNRRHPIAYMARLELRPGKIVRCMLSDISDSGARLIAELPQAPPT